jgi:broad specificity phosphatase PhoE
MPAGGLYLARHGQTAYNLGRRFQGHLPVPLDETGRTQAAALAEAVADVAPVTLVCSGLARAQETAGIVGARVGLEPVVDRRFDETDAGDWTDRPFADVIAEDPDGFGRFVALDPAWAFPGGESFAGQTERVLAGVEDWRARAQESGPIVVVCHGVTIRLALLALRGEDPMAPGNGSLVAL